MGLSLIFSCLENMELKLRVIHLECKICLNDINLANMLFRKEPDGSFLCVFSDTDKSTFDVSDECKKDDTKRFKEYVNNFKESTII